MKKTILVTGANRGIGLETCRQLLLQEHRVILCSRDITKGEKAARSLKGDVVVKELDVNNINLIHQLADWVGDEFGTLDVLINNAGIGSDSEVQVPFLSSEIKNKLRMNFPAVTKLAGIMRKTGLLKDRTNPYDLSMDGVKRVMETNFYGPWRMIRAFIPLLEKSEDPRIINISSGMGQLKGLSGSSPGYSLSKASLNALTIMFSNDLKSNGIRVYAMCPGWVRTHMGGPNAPRSVEDGADTAVWLATENGIAGGKFYRDRHIIDW